MVSIVVKTLLYHPPKHTLPNDPTNSISPHLHILGFRHFEINRI